MGQGELEALLGELADVGAPDVLGLLELDDTENLSLLVQDHERVIRYGRRTWMEAKRARWRAAMSEYRDSTASARLISRYSLYMLWVPEREL